MALWQNFCQGVSCALRRKGHVTRKKENIQFTSSESDLLIEILKQNLSAEDAKKVDMMLRIMRKPTR